LNPAYTDGSAEDEWKDGAFRIDIYWFARNAGDPAQTFYPQFWNLLRDKCIPYRLHWGKFLPDGDTAAFAAVKAQYPKWDDFLDQRAAADPDGTFLNEYWRTHLGLPPADGPTPA
jgi:D-arabinono-1,4-lactone oxidase